MNQKRWTRDFDVYKQQMEATNVQNEDSNVMPVSNVKPFHSTVSSGTKLHSLDSLSKKQAHTVGSMKRSNRDFIPEARERKGKNGICQIRNMTIGMRSFHYSRATQDCQYSG